MTLTGERSVLLFADEWRCMADGLHGVNRSLALNLSRYKGVRVYCALLTPTSNITNEDRKDADDLEIVLVGASLREGEHFKASVMWRRFNADPNSVFPALPRVIPHVTHIIGHAPVTAEGAVKFRDVNYRDSKVFLFYHVLPENVSWLEGTLPYEAPSDESLVFLAERADVVFSVTEPLHWYYSAKFRNRARQNIHHRLFLPMARVEMFQVDRTRPDKGETPVILVLTSGAPAVWHGIDIAACAVNKVALSLTSMTSKRKILKVVFGNVSDVEAVRQLVAPYLTAVNLEVEYHTYSGIKDLQKDLKRATIAIQPCRAEPLGHQGLSLISAGVPCLLPEGCALSTMVKNLTSNPSHFLVPVTSSATAVQQDASVWRDRILNHLADLNFAHACLVELRTILRCYETPKVTHDDVIRCCLGGISLRHHVTRLTFKVKNDADAELSVLGILNQFLSDTLCRCWRLKHHPLVDLDDLSEFFPGIPFKDLLDHVINKIEEQDRRIVCVDDVTGYFIVYCPTPNALRDLWAMCDVINRSLVQILLGGAELDILGKFGLKDAYISTSISGPEFLKYKRELVKVSRPKTAAF